ncbi:hypothetical protein C1J03_13285 [Sulfitobacter sp. SK012]|uniref:methyl-accepting chemotaxis protein n=1 Tax=Sulfitobacter sp. SK012 TaxID=1389005 RepID=UPI000E0BBFDA|nr:methyl-accepting chemotaxis protein [Sulfitobacter sp. SK012]AXI46909.1 hypothetical protein C1J03_13285 [Sulfitobacter sp. SK012]
MDICAPPNKSDEFDHKASESIRRAIDMVATLRARAVRLGLFSSLLRAQEPGQQTLQIDRDRYLAILHDEIATITKVNATLTHGALLPGATPALSRWVHSVAQQKPEVLEIITAMEPLNKDLLWVTEQKTSTQYACFQRHMNFARDVYFDAVTHMADALWSDFQMRHDLELASATQAAKALSERLYRLERIGKHVRLVSLNASVEATRAGDVGKGLIVIAQEFKSLAEEIQTLAQAARGDMALIS